jgi:DNA-binding NarL/FixJ family response regulator
VTPIQLLVVDDHDLMRTCLVRILNDVDDFLVVGEAASGEEAIKLSRRLLPNVVLMDVKMPGIGGVEATKTILAQNSQIKIIAITACEDDIYPIRLLKAGAFAYLTKRTEPTEVIKAIKMVVAGKPYVSQNIAQRLALKNSRLLNNTDSPFDRLSQRELQIAMMTVRGEKPIAIAEKLNVSAKTINSYRYRIFEKFNITNDVELVHFAIKHKVFDVDMLE